jgi:hypothetical protein
VTNVTVGVTFLVLEPRAGQPCDHAFATHHQREPRDQAVRLIVPSRPAEMDMHDNYVPREGGAATSQAAEWEGVSTKHPSVLLSPSR